MVKTCTPVCPDLFSLLPNLKPKDAKCMERLETVFSKFLNHLNDLEATINDNIATNSTSVPIEPFSKIKNNLSTFFSELLEFSRKKLNNVLLPDSSLHIIGSFILLLNKLRKTQVCSIELFISPDDQTQFFWAIDRTQTPAIVPVRYWGKSCHIWDPLNVNNDDKVSYQPLYSLDLKLSDLRKYRYVIDHPFHKAELELNENLKASIIEMTNHFADVYELPNIKTANKQGASIFIGSCQTKIDIPTDSSKAAAPGF